MIFRRFCFALMPLFLAIKVIANTGVVLPTAITYSVWPSRHVIFSSSCQHLNRLESKMVYKKGLAIMLFAHSVKPGLTCLQKLLWRFPYVQVYALRGDALLLLAHQSRLIARPKNTHFNYYYIGDKSDWLGFSASDLYMAHMKSWQWQDVGKTLPLFFALRSHMPHAEHNKAASQLAMAVLTHNTPLMLSASMAVLGVPISHSNRALQQYALGVAMLANIKLQQYRSVLMLWDAYAKSLFQKQVIPIDFYLLKHKAIYHLSRHLF